MRLFTRSCWLASIKSARRRHKLYFILASSIQPKDCNSPFLSFSIFSFFLIHFECALGRSAWMLWNSWAKHEAKQFKWSFYDVVCFDDVVCFIVMRPTISNCVPTRSSQSQWKQNGPTIRRRISLGWLVLSQLQTQQVSAWHVIILICHCYCCCWWIRFWFLFSFARLLSRCRHCWLYVLWRWDKKCRCHCALVLYERKELTTTTKPHSHQIHFEFLFRTFFCAIRNSLWRISRAHIHLYIYTEYLPPLPHTAIVNVIAVIIVKPESSRAKHSYYYSKLASSHSQSNDQPRPSRIKFFRFVVVAVAVAHNLTSEIEMWKASPLSQSTNRTFSVA